MAAFLPALLFPALWLGVSYANAARSGWLRLATRYAARGAPPPGARAFGREAGRVGDVSMRGRLRVTAGPEALWLSGPAAFRPGHPTLRIPWEEIAVVRTETLDAHPVTVLSVGRPPVGSVTLRSRTADAIAELTRAAR